MAAITLRRYTNLAATIYMLRNKAITLLDPILWDDKNDTFFLSLYRDYKKAQSLRVLCFAEASETYHHWRVFSHGSDGSDGTCIEFNKDELLAALNSTVIQWGSVKYEEIKSLRSRRPTVDELPFLKRLPFEPEQEFRLVYIDSEALPDAKDFAIPLTCIRRITLSPWVPVPLFDAVKCTLLEIPDCGELKVYRSTLIENEKWKKAAEGLTPA